MKCAVYAVIHVCGYS